jgi:hypothetical protein
LLDENVLAGLGIGSTPFLQLLNTLGAGASVANEVDAVQFAKEKIRTVAQN